MNQINPEECEDRALFSFIGEAVYVRHSFEGEDLQSSSEKTVIDRLRDR
jgi:hypothetical protein